MSAKPEFLVARIEELIRRRTSTDRRMGYAWMIVPLLPILVGIVLAVSFVGIILSAIPRMTTIEQTGTFPQPIAELFSLYLFAIASFFVVMVLGSFALYYFIDRRNAHFNRQKQLFRTVAEYLESRAAIKVGENVSTLSYILDDAAVEEQDRPAGVWAVLNLFVTPIVSLFVAYSLTQDFRGHEQRQQRYISALPAAFGDVGLTSPTFPTQTTRGRDPLLYVVLTVITGGLFWVYWFYTILRDYNNHFRAQAKIEDDMLATLRPKTLTATCATCGGSVPENAKFCPFCGRSL